MIPAKKDIWDNAWLRCTNDLKWPASVSVDAMVLGQIQGLVWEYVYNQSRIHVFAKIRKIR